MSKSSKQTTNTSQQQSIVTTPTNPTFVDNGLASLGGQITNFGKVDPYSLVAGADPLQTQAASGAANLSTPQGYQDAISMFKSAGGAGASTYAPSTATSASLLDGLSSYMSPYTSQVVDSALKDYDFGAGQTQAQNKLSLANDDTFGGSGGAIQTSMSNDAINRGRGTLSAQLNDQAFQVGAGLSSSDAQRRQETSLANMSALNSAGQFDAQAQDLALQRQLAAGGAITDASTAQGADARSNVATQATLGQMLQQLAQARASAPLSQLSAQSAMWSQLPLSLLHGGTTTGDTTGTSSTKGSEWGLTGADFAKLAAAAVAASDVRLKRDIVKLGERPDGLGVYLYRYLWSPLRYIGVMAQEVLKVKPEAVLIMPNGFYAVDYGKL